MFNIDISLYFQSKSINTVEDALLSHLRAVPPPQDSEAAELAFGEHNISSDSITEITSMEIGDEKPNSTEVITENTSMETAVETQNSTEGIAENSVDAETVFNKRIAPAHFLCITLQRNTFTANYKQFYEDKEIELTRTLTIEPGKKYANINSIQ